MSIAKIAKNELEGLIEYEDSSPVRFYITFPDEKIRREIITYRSLRVNIGYLNPKELTITGLTLNRQLPVVKCILN